MTIASALSSAMTGLNANARMAELTASNVANALTPGYARRELQLSANTVGSLGGGVQIDGVARRINQILVHDLRQANATAAAENTRANFLKEYETRLGSAEDGASLSSRLATLESSLIEAASRPDIDSRLAQVTETAKSLANGLNSLSEYLHATREQADTAIASNIATLNNSLKGVEALNKQILNFITTGRDTASLLDQRQQLIDNISDIVPLREAQKPNGQIVLYTTSGLALLNGRAAEISFKPTPLITADMSLQSGALSGLTVDGKSITTAPNGGRLGDGKLSSLFALRDQDIPVAQRQLDGIARELIDRLADNNIDPSNTNGVPGLFTDAGHALNPADEAGVASRIRVNSAVLPEKGGAYFRLRDGMGATSAGPTGNKLIITRLSEALAAVQTPSSGALSQTPRNFVALIGSAVSSISTDRLAAEQKQSFTSARREVLSQELLRDGVDTDQEMEMLLRIEKAYTANAKVLQTVDDMLRTILGI